MRRMELVEHRKVTSVPEKPSNGSPMVIRVTVTDPYATDSSSDDEEDVTVTSPIPRGKRYVEEIILGEPVTSSKRKAKNKVEKDNGDDSESVKPKKYRGVKQRPWGKFGSQIWLGTYDTAEEAAMVYDRAVIQLKGHNAQTNFLTPPPRKPVSRQSNEEAAESRTEVEIESTKVSTEKNPAIVEEELQASLFSDLYSLTEWTLTDEYMWKSEIAHEKNQLRK